MIFSGLPRRERNTIPFPAFPASSWASVESGLTGMGCWDYPLKRDRAELFSLEERRMPSYHL